MPFDIEGKLSDRLFVGEIEHLLDKQSAHHGVELPWWDTPGGMENAWPTN